MELLILLSVLMITSGFIVLRIGAKKLDEWNEIERLRKLAEAEEVMDYYSRHARENALHVTRFLNSKNGTEETSQADDQTQASKQEDR